jgi:hypothetical protein
MAQRRGQGRQAEGGASDADLAQHLGLLDWDGLEPIGDGQARGGEGGDLGFFLGGELLQAEEPGACCILVLLP